MIVAKPPSKGIKSRKRKRETEEAIASAEAGFREESKRDGSHDSSAMENSGLQEQFSIKEIGRSAAGNVSLDDSGNGGGLQTPKGKHEKGFD